MAPDLESFETTACVAARAGGEVLRRRFRGGHIRVESKGLHDFVTDVDREAEAAVVACLRAAFPEHGIQAEEGFPNASEDALRWIVDPLDGTTNFLHGVPTFAVSVALSSATELLAGAVYDPLRDEMFHARRGAGARLDGSPIRCSAPASLHEALIATGFPFRELDRLDLYLAAFERFCRVTAGLRRAGAAALDLAYSACGRYDGFWEIGLRPWDVAAGALLVIEAGGVVTDPFGGSGYLASGDVVAAGPFTHREMLEITRSCLGKGNAAG